jgi:hypothetical protein
MTKYLLTGFAGVFLLLITCIGANGQPAAANMRLSPKSSISKNAVITANRNTVNPKAVRDFMRSYKSVSNEKWYQLQHGLVVIFSLDTIKYQVEYDRKGAWLYTIRIYNENILPRDIRHLVKSTYYDYAIRLVHEIETPRHTFTYIVLLDGTAEFINLRVSDGEMDEWQKFKKSE